MLNKGAIFCNVSISDNGVGLVCKSIIHGKYFILNNVDKCVFFQKMSYQELLILHAIDTIQYNP